MLLAEEPRNGYGLMEAIEERSGGRWRPSPGSVYPTLSQLEDEGLIRATEREGSKVFEVTEAGQQNLAERSDESAPWQQPEGTDADALPALGSLIKETVMAVRQVMRAGDPAQLERARQVLTETRRAMYLILAGEDQAPGDSRSEPDTLDRMSAVATQPAIVVDKLVKTYGQVEAVRGVEFEVAPGEVFGFLGPNGAGKTTTINMLCTLVKPTSGRASVAGHDVVSERDDVRRNIGLVFQDPTLDSYLTAEQNLRLHAELYGLRRDVVAPRMRQVLEMVGLWERKDSVVGTFSGGMRRRLEIARGMMHSPRVLFLDEPTIGLDPQTRRSIWSYIRELKEREEITIFMTTHYMDEAEWCDRIAIMDHGEIVALDAPETLKAGVGTDRVMIPPTTMTPPLPLCASASGSRPAWPRAASSSASPAASSSYPACSPSSEVPIQGVSVSRPSLDDVFMSYTGTTIRDAEEDAAKNRNRRMMQMMHGGRR